MEIARKTLIQVAVVALCLGLLWFIYISKTVVLFVVVALILAVSMYPLVEKLEKRKISKVLATVIVMILLMGIIFGIVGTIATPLFIQGTSLLKNLPEITHRVITNPNLASFAAKYHVADYLNQLSDSASKIVLGGGSSIISVAGSVIRIVSSTVVVLVLTFLFMIEGEEMWGSVLHFFKRDDRVTVHKVGLQIKKAIGGFITGNLFISLIAGVVTLITLFILKVPYMFALAALVALFDLIPLIGAAIATVAVGFVALTQGTTVALIAVGVLLIYQFVEGHFIQPIVYSRSINLSPLVIVLASIIGAETAGITGVLLAIPIGAIVQIVGKEIYAHYVEDSKT